MIRGYAGCTYLVKVAMIGSLLKKGRCSFMQTVDYVINIGDDSEILTVMEKCMATPENIPNTDFQKAKKLLNGYKHVLWTINSNVLELDEECRAVMNEELSYAIEVLDKFDYHIDFGRLESKLEANQETRQMAKLIVMAMIKVKDYPDLGECYYRVLQMNYIRKEKIKETDILFDLDIARSTYYKYKKDAVKVFGYCLWQIILPSVRTAQTKVKDVLIMST